MDVGVGDFVGPPKADINDRTYVGNQNSERDQNKHDSIPLDRPIFANDKSSRSYSSRRISFFLSFELVRRIRKQVKDCQPVAQRMSTPV